MDKVMTSYSVTEEEEKERSLEKYPWPSHPTERATGDRAALSKGQQLPMKLKALLFLILCITVT